MRYQGVALLAGASLASAQTGSSWATALQKADAALAKLSSQDKINMVTGVGWNKGPCVGNTPAISSIGYPQLCLQDSPLGIRYASSVTAFTPGIQAGATWDRALIRERGLFMGEETKASGIHVLLGPVAGPLGKIPAQLLLLPSSLSGCRSGRFELADVEDVLVSWGGCGGGMVATATTARAQGAASREHL